MKLQSKTPLVLITGASSGIGQALALHYMQRGWHLALVARRTDVIHSWLGTYETSADSYEIYSADVACADSMAAMAQTCLTRQGVPDVVIANAGISLGVDSSVRADLEVMARILATNVMGVAATFGPFIAPMTARGSGSLVGMGSVAGIRGLPGHGGYCASKAAVISYCESLRGELRGSGVKVVTICPGYIATPLTQNNRYHMPFLMQPQAFAEQAVQAIDAGCSYRVIPWQMGLVAKLLRLLPNALFDRVFAGRPRKPRAPD
ncbi:MAG: SDR family oxidoreductase [Rhodoferax sp.]|nr:SDR family oxidoreductase [Betaproteobacteria bacterium]NCN97649.1 SDR family oxidoreductase [Rhodoferax sp.]OIP17208.1 MAG: short-chain dehydrogenase [Comamonadaceae bacterium CG2_30_57_122]PIZ21770.1 MAG: short-chain dehydrogenase [Comamonadaceae bacterium CG_4_10_14_0_8_um_filter_57_29]PJC19902.1 MAG: short-chain dehydrogenase [Comamonadaceae bacterium CG_4_9_14_0_8_um_filter_57_21]